MKTESSKILIVSLLLACSAFSFLFFPFSADAYYGPGEQKHEEKLRERTGFQNATRYNIERPEEDLKVTFVTRVWNENEILLDDTGGAKRFVGRALDIFFAVVGTILVLQIAFQGFKLIWGQYTGSVTNASAATGKLRDVAIGVGILLFSWLILQFVDPDLLKPRFFSGQYANSFCSHADISVHESTTLNANKVGRVSLVIPGAPQLRPKSAIKKLLDNTDPNFTYTPSYKYYINYKRGDGTSVFFRDGVAPVSLSDLQSLQQKLEPLPKNFLKYQEIDAPPNGNWPHREVFELGDSTIDKDTPFQGVSRVFLTAELTVTKRNEADGTEEQLFSVPCRSVVKEITPAQCLAFRLRKPSSKAETLQDLLITPTASNELRCLPTGVIEKCMYECGGDFFDGHSREIFYNCFAEEETYKTLDVQESELASVGEVVFKFFASFLGAGLSRGDLSVPTSEGLDSVYVVNIMNDPEINVPSKDGKPQKKGCPVDSRGNFIIKPYDR